MRIWKDDLDSINRTIVRTDLIAFFPKLEAQNTYREHGRQILMEVID